MESNDTHPPNMFIHLACVVTLVPAIYIYLHTCIL